MKMARSPDEYLLRTGVILLCGGVLSGAYGVYRWCRFFKDAMQSEQEPGLGIVAIGLILPHVFTFLGIGIATYGVILTVKSWRFRAQLRRDQQRR
jgi:uncharacterized membrane protein YidH (DUF202 family)